MESNGVGRLFTYTRELAVGAMRAGGEAVRNEPAEKVLPKQPPTESGVRLSLSPSATASLEPSAATSAEVAEPASLIPTAADTALRAVLGSAIAAYQRNASATLGGQFSIRA